MQDDEAMCPNNCVGVDPNSIIGGGVAAVALSGLALTSSILPIGVGVLGAAGESQVTALECIETVFIARHYWRCHADGNDAENSMSYPPVSSWFRPVLLLLDSRKQGYLSSQLLIVITPQREKINIHFKQLVLKEKCSNVLLIYS